MKGGANGESIPTLPANKAQLYSATQPPPKRGHRRGCCCSCCLWTTLAILLLLLAGAIAGAAFYVIYRPHRPSFTVKSLQLNNFILTDTSLTSSFNFSIAARNPNKKITFFYDAIAVKFLSGDLDIAHGSIHGFTHGRKNSTTLRSVVSSSGIRFPDSTDIATLKNKNLPLKIQLESKMSVKIGKIKTKKLKIRVTCDGIKLPVTTGGTETSATNLLPKQGNFQLSSAVNCSHILKWRKLRRAKYAALLPDSVECPPCYLTTLFSDSALPFFVDLSRIQKFSG